MEKTLNYLALAIKAITVTLGALTAADAGLLHLSTTAIGTIVGGLGTAGLVVHTLQVSTAAAATPEK